MLGLPEDRPWLIGVVHLAATPGAPRWSGSLCTFEALALADAQALLEGGADALIVENFGDVPFFAERVPPETVAAMAIVTRRIVERAGPRPVGVNVLRNDARAALALCATTGARFLRVNVLSGAAVTDQGLVQGRAADVLRERARLCPEAALLADLRVKHAAPLVPLPLAQEAEDLVRRALADGVIVSGPATGSPPRRDDLREVWDLLGGAALLVGSGLDLENAASLLEHADGAIVGTALKEGGRVEAPVDPERVRALAERLAELPRARRRGGGGA